jgi:hypothetical protein
LRLHMCKVLMDCVTLLNLVNNTAWINPLNRLIYETVFVVKSKNAIL